MPRKMPKSLHSWLIPKLRKLSMWWPGKTIARDRAKVYIQDGFYKNGKAKMTVRFKCDSCKNLFKQEETEMNHITNVVDVKGFKDWNEYIESLFCDSNGYNCLCIACHEKVTKRDNIIRKRYKKKK